MTDRQRDCSETFIDDEGFAELEEAGNVKLSISKRAELNAAISYCVRLRDWHDAYSPKAIKARDRVAKIGQKFKVALSALEEPAKLSVVLGDDEGFVHFMQPGESSSAPRQFLDQLDASIERCESNASYTHVRRSARPKDAHLLDLCSKVINIYEGRILYGGSRFRCRRCYRLKYESQYEPAFGRAASKAHKLRARLGYSGSLDDPFPAKPKGMHWKTYRRLEAEDEHLQHQWAVGIMGWMERLEPSWR